jgi:tRNA (guanosine-2'-O-)-methyltransferase
VVEPLVDGPHKPELHLNKVLPLSGGEICFNAWDDNQNSLLDEGCDIDQGPIQVMIAWSEADCDVDLFVQDPDGEIAYSGVGTDSGLHASSDCPGDKDKCSGQNYENVVLEELGAPGGPYQVRVRIEKWPEGRPSVRVALGIRSFHRSFSHEIVFFEAGQETSLEFEVLGTRTEGAEAEEKSDEKSLPNKKRKE